MRVLLVPLTVLIASSACTGLGASSGGEQIDVTVHEGTSMSVAVSPDGRTLAIDLQGSIWTLPATGGAARRITDEFNDARQPAWSPDGSLIAFQGYRDGGYDIWVVAPDGSGLHKLTEGIYDDREPSWSHDGIRVAFSSDREGATGNYDIWTVDVRDGTLSRLTSDAADEFMPTWSPGDSAIAFVSERGRERSLSIVSLAGGTVRTVDGAPEDVDAPSWGPGGDIVYHVAEGRESSRLELAGRGRPLTGDENAFAFRVSWASPTEFYYTSDGLIRKRSMEDSSSVETVPFSATLAVTTARYVRRVRDLDSRAPRTVKGIVAPRISPDGERVAFAAIGDIWVMRIGEAPRKITDDRFLDAEPAWSPDGNRIAYSSDRGGHLLDLWIHDVRTGESHQLTTLPTSAMGAAWSPDGSRIAFLDVDAIWRRASVSVVDVATRKVTKIKESSFGPGTPSWSSDGRHVALAAVVPYSTRFREGTNRILVIPSAPGVIPSGSEGSLSVGIDPSVASLPRDDDRRSSRAGGEGSIHHAPIPGKSIDSRVGAGPVWSPDGTKMLFIHDGVLWLLPVSSDGVPAGEARRLTDEMAHEPSWTADSRRVLYQSMDRLRLLDIETGDVSDVLLELRYTPAIPTERLVVHASRVVDMLRPAARENVDVLIDGNRITAVQPHDDALHDGRRLVDATGLTVMPGLIEYHTHLQKDFGAAHGRAWLAFGITTVRSPGGTPYEAAEDREAVDAGVRLGPRVYSTGYLMEWQRTYYKMAVAIASEQHLEMELERARALEHDLIKSYVRMPDLMQRRIVEFAHTNGIPASSHEIYPSAMVGIDGVEHTTGTSRRGYSPKVATMQRSYGDVAAIVGGADMTFTSTMTLGPTWLRRIVAEDPALASDPRFALLPPWLEAPVRRMGSGPTTRDAGPIGEMVMAMQRAGARVVAGTDTPNPANLHAELRAYVAAGMTPYEALRAATIVPAEALGLEAGTIERGRLADLVIVQGNPLERIGDAYRVRAVIANGRVVTVPE